MVAAGALLLLAGCASKLSPERETVAFYVWAERGQTVGEYARLYCNQAAARQRQVMRWGMDAAAGGAKVIIHCPGVPE